MSSYLIIVTRVTTKSTIHASGARLLVSLFDEASVDRVIRACELTRRVIVIDRSSADQVFKCNFSRFSTVSR